MEDTTKELPIYPAARTMAQEWEQMQLLYDAALREVNTKLEILNNEFKLTHQYNPIEHISSRIKSPESIAKKLRHKNRDLTVENIVKYINDVAGIRVICSFTSDIYRIAGLIAGQSDVTVLKVKDYIEHPKENGYRSYHMIVSVPIFLSDAVVDTKVEIQIRTIAMDFWASLEHKMYYKFEGNAPSNIRRELKECADLASFLDQKMLAINEEIRDYTEEEKSSFELEDYIKNLYGTVLEEEETEDIVQEAKEVEIDESKDWDMEALEKENDIKQQEKLDKENFFNKRMTIQWRKHNSR